MVVHGEQLVAVPQDRYLGAWKRLPHCILAGKRSPIEAAPGA